MRFYGDGTDELHLALNVPFVFAELGDEMRVIVEQEEAVIPAEAWPTWTGSNHDAARFPTRWCGGDDRKIRAALVMLLTLRGTPILYYGDEIGMSDVAVPHDRLRDPVGLRGWPAEPGRDRARTPMPWTGGPNLGFTLPGVEPWLPVGDPRDQRCRPARRPRFRAQPHAGIDRAAAGTAGPPRGRLRRRSKAPDGIWAWRRGNDTLVVLNHSDGPIDAGRRRGEILLSSHADRAGERIERRVRVEPWEALVIAKQTGA